VRPGTPAARHSSVLCDEAALPPSSDHDFLFLRPPFFLRFLGTLAPERRASDRPIAIACFLLFTFFPERPLRSVPRLRSCIVFFTFLDARLLYFRAITILQTDCDSLLQALNMPWHGEMASRGRPSYNIVARSRTPASSVSIDMADCRGVPLRRLLDSADRFSDAAIRAALRDLNTLFSRSSASLRRVTSADHLRVRFLALAFCLRCGVLLPTVRRVLRFFVAIYPPSSFLLDSVAIRCKRRAGGWHANCSSCSGPFAQARFERSGPMNGG
jgi:hypothetical protein